LNVDLGINVRIFDIETEIRQGAIDKKESLSAALPMAYAAIQFMPIERLAFEAETRSISLSDNSIFSLTGKKAPRLMPAVRYTID